jgi:transcriptional regulator with GAF, ATPase, and Fis domain
MRSASNSVMQITEYIGSMPTSAVVYRSNEPYACKGNREEPFSLEAIVGRRGSLRGVVSQVEAVAPTDTTVLIAGETGTGKEIIARAIHELSPAASVESSVRSSESRVQPAVVLGQ